MAFQYAAALSGTSSRILRAALLESGLELAPLVEGVRQDSFPDLERTLTALAGEYANGDATRKRQVRRAVIEARQHAEWASRNPKASAERRAQKAEMLLWLRTWLENPPLFRDWVAMRKRAAPL